MSGLRDEGKQLDREIEALSGEFVALPRSGLATPRLTSIHGIRLMDATALVTAAGEASSFPEARNLAAWLGLVPGSTLLAARLGFTAYASGDTYLRTLLIHSVRSALHSLSQSNMPLRRWLRAMIDCGALSNAVLVALANELARTAWAILRNETDFDRGYPVGA